MFFSKFFGFHQRIVYFCTRNQHSINMNKKLFFILFNLLFCIGLSHAQDAEKSELQKRAEAVDTKKSIGQARSLYIHAFNDYASKGQMKLGVECAAKAAALYYKENLYKEAFDLLRTADQAVNADKKKSGSEKAALHYQLTKERLQMYLKLRKSASAFDQLNILTSLANQSGDESVKNDLLYTKAIYHYTFGQNAQGNAVFKEMAAKLTGEKEYDKVDEVYQTLIANARKSNNASMVAQSYSNYIAWKDSISALKAADEVNALKQQIADNESAIAEKDSSLSTRQMIIIGLSILLAALAAVLIIGGVILMRYILLTRKQKKNIKLANESNALKAKFISSISAQLEPTLRKLDNRIPEVKALNDFASHIQTLSDLENMDKSEIEMKETQIAKLCETLMDEIRNKVKRGVTLTVNAQNMNAEVNKEYVSHIIRHLLNNAAEYTPENGTICLEFKKRGPHSYQFLVSDTGSGIPEEKQEDIFKPFLEIRDLTTGDGLGLPICKQMAQKMNGDLDIDTKYTKGARFVLDLHS